MSFDHPLLVVAGITIIGDPLLARDQSGRLKSRIGTVFPRHQVVVTVPGIHAVQRRIFLDWLKSQRQAAGQPPLDEQEEARLWNTAVDLIMEEDDSVLIRPEPQEMGLAYEGDEVLRRLVAKRQVRFLHVLNPEVRAAVKRRGEAWRITPLPTMRGEMALRIESAKIAIHGREIYYYNRTTGTRWLTCEEFSRLGELGDEPLRQHLEEIQRHSRQFNHQYNPEIALFMAEGFSSADFSRYRFAELDPAALRGAYDELRARFCDAVPPEFRYDDPTGDAWRGRMFSALIAERDEVVSEETMLGLSPEFYMQIQWLPGGRFVRGEPEFDEVFGEPAEAAAPPGGGGCDQNVREFFLNLIREYDDLEYVNIGRVVNSLSRGQREGRRDVYIAVLKQHGAEEETVNIIRMQKWGVRENLARGWKLPDAINESEEYTEFCLDRRIGCRHLGMNIPRRITARKIAERFVGPQTGPGGIPIYSPYFERAYVRGIASDKMPRHRFDDPEFALRFAWLLGRAAAPNLIVGRCDGEQHVLFDDGDEVVIEDAAGMPAEIVVPDHTGTFRDFQRELELSAPAYAGPVNRRLEFLPNAEQFAAIYLAAFIERFEEIQLDCRRRRKMLEILFNNRKYDPNGSIAYRWHTVRERLDRADPRRLAEIIRSHLGIAAVCS